MYMLSGIRHSCYQKVGTGNENYHLYPALFEIIQYYNAHTIQCILHCAVYRAGNTVKCADCIVFSHGRIVVNRDCHKSRHSSLVDRGIRGARLMITPSEISLHMHYCLLDPRGAGHAKAFQFLSVGP